MKKIDTGLYLGNLHYLNWSDNIGGRITGMTRYACFWVEDGEIVAPIENMRFEKIKLIKIRLKDVKYSIIIRSDAHRSLQKLLDEFRNFGLA